MTCQQMIQMGIIVSLLIVIKIVERHAPHEKKICQRKSIPFYEQGTERGDIY